MREPFRSFTQTQDTTEKADELDILVNMNISERLNMSNFFLFSLKDFCVNGGRRWVNFSIHFSSFNIQSSIFRQPYCSNTTNVNLCSHIWSVCYLAQSVFDSKVVAEPCLRKCPSGVNLYPVGAKPERIPKKSRYGFALNYGVPMGQSTPKTWAEWIQI